MRRLFRRNFRISRKFFVREKEKTPTNATTPQNQVFYKKEKLTNCDGSDSDNIFKKPDNKNQETEVEKEKVRARMRRY